MGQESAPDVKRCETRYAIADCKSTHVGVVTSGEQGTQRHEGYLADLSSTGVRVALGVRPQKGSSIEFHLTIDRIQLKMHTTAVVRWLQPRDSDTWWVGCELSEQIPVDVIEAMASAGLLDRRRDPRYEISHPGVAKWELADEQMDVQVVDYSKGGFCMLCQEAKHFPSDRVMLLIENGEHTAKVPGRVMWQRQLERGYAVGCCFTTLDSFVTFRDIVEPGRRERQNGQSRMNRPMSLTRWVAISAFVLLTVKGLELIRDEPIQRRTLGKAVIQRFVETIQTNVLGKPDDDPNVDRTVH